MEDTDKIKMQLIQEVKELRQRLAELESAEIKRGWSQNALQESEARYQDLFDGVPIGLSITTTDGQYLDANLALVEILGYPDWETRLAINATDL